MFLKNRKIINGWIFYDWANSVYSLVISTAIFPIYYISVLTKNGNDTIYFLGIQLPSSALYSYVLSFSFLIVFFISPLLSGIADYTNQRKLFLKIFCYLGASACMLLFFYTDRSTLWIALTGTILASIGFWGSLVFYNSYLPEITDKNNQDQVSAKGYMVGYLGSSILLILCLFIIQNNIIGDTQISTRFCFLLVGLWWIGFAQFTFNRLPKNKNKSPITVKSIKSGYFELIYFWKRLKKNIQLKIFLFSFIFLSMGVQTVILLASIFGSKELGLETSNLILTILIIQFLGIFGAWVFSKISIKLGNINSLKIALLIWILITIFTFFLTRDTAFLKLKFYIIAGFVGIVMGGIQSLARSTYSKMLPKKGKHTTFFSFYDVSEKISIVFGTFIFGFIENITKNLHLSILSLSIFFILSFILLLFIKKQPLTFYETI